MLEQELVAVRSAVDRVRELHSPHSIYDDCDHDHTWDDADEYEDLVDVDPVGLVCVEGWVRDICRECHADDEGNETELTAVYGWSWPCRTRQSLDGGDQ